MHELSLAYSIAEIAVGSIREQACSPGSRVLSVRVRVGDLAGVDTEALTFCFEVVRAEWRETGEASIEIQRCPARIRCLECGRVGVWESQASTLCPCGADRGEVFGGRELEVFGVELSMDLAE